jgi:hypothetical protein
MKFSGMLAIVGGIIFIWCSMVYSDRLYTWEDDKGVTHITKEPPPQKTKLIDTMDYTVTPAQMNQTTGEQVLDEDERSRPQRIGTSKRRNASNTNGIPEDVNEDVYYDSDGGRYTRRAIRHEIREQRDNRRETDRPVTKHRKKRSGGRK